MAGTVVADTLQAAATSTLLIQTGNGAPVTAVSIDTSQNVKFAGAIRSSAVSTPPTIQDSAGTQIGTFCRAWVNFNGTTNTGGFCTIVGSFNVSSVADNGTGIYTVNFTTAMPDANYSILGTPQALAALYGVHIYGTATNPFVGTTTSCQIAVTNDAGSKVDSGAVCVSVFR